MAAVDVGTGATLNFMASGFSLRWTQLALVETDRKGHETTHLATALPGVSQIGSRTFKPGDLVDPGRLICTGFFDSNENPPFHAPVEQILLTFPIPMGAIQGAVWMLYGFLVRLRGLVPHDDLMGCTTEVKCTAPITILDEDEAIETLEGYDAEWEWDGFFGEPPLIYDAEWES